MTNERECGNQFNRIHNKMLNASTVDEAVELYDTACSIRQCFAMGKCAMKDCDRCFLTKEKNDLIREIRKRPPVAITYNLFGCNVTICNGNVTMKGDKKR